MIKALDTLLTYNIYYNINSNIFLYLQIIYNYVRGDMIEQRIENYKKGKIKR